MSDHIPLEIVTNILERLRVNDLVRCRRVSKQWLAVIDSPQFIRSKLRSSTSTTSNAAVFLQPQAKKDANNLLCWREEFGSNSNNTSGDGFSSSGPIEYRYVPDQVLLMGSCHGLICFARVHRPHDLVVLNPSTGERHVLDSFFNDVEFDDVRAYGFGYDEISQGYKVVLITSIPHDFAVNIYDLRHKTVSVTVPTDTTTFWHIMTAGQIVGVFFSGAIHWSTFEFSELGCAIQALDLATETVRRLPVPPNLVSADKVELNLAVVDSCFCVSVLNKNAGEIAIWLMKEYGRRESWSKIYTVIRRQDSVPGSVIPLGSNGGRILLMFDRCRFVWCDPVKNLVVEAVRANIGDETYEAVYCVESLVMLFQMEVDSDADKKDYYRVMEVKRKEHEAKLMLQDEEKPSNFCFLL
ncbi:F-box protein CPR1 [Linum grandiflorum]